MKSGEMSEPQTSRVEVLGRAFVVYGGKAATNVLGYLSKEEIAQLQKLAASARSAGIPWQEWQQRFGH